MGLWHLYPAWVSRARVFEIRAARKKALKVNRTLPRVLVYGLAVLRVIELLVATMIGDKMGLYGSGITGALGILYIKGGDSKEAVPIKNTDAIRHVWGQILGVRTIDPVDEVVIV